MKDAVIYGFVGLAMAWFAGMFAWLSIAILFGF